MSWLAQRLALHPLTKWQRKRFVLSGIALTLSGVFSLIVMMFPTVIWEKSNAKINSLTPDIANGKYIYHLSGCSACHTEHVPGAKELAGGKRLRTPFGILVAPNVTPDTLSGIGGWTVEEFADATRLGISPDGEHYYPAFPYTSYSRMTDQDIVDLKAYIDTQVAPVAEKAEERDLLFPFSIRYGMGMWKLLYLDEEPKTSKVEGEQAKRGEYLAEVLGHCGECHSPRDIMGGVIRSRWMSGVPVGEFNPAPNITNTVDGTLHWTDKQWLDFLKTGVLPDGNYTGGEMALVVEEITSHLSKEDADAMVKYFRSLTDEGGTNAVDPD
ncbi:c-type cytochrome [Veronia pacifica]|uniref:Diheme cytochrome c-553 n=1 Tax=Veronia pacifica TaxID=1080227 RepID=A0A1C3EEY5_9GAMM|nr:cytochrome c [Veronia pacifica]ODA31783.1 diheme cytochrome c-553 [Veronia pacifica]